MEGRQAGWSGSAFSPASSRQSSIALLRNVGTGDHRIVTSISTRKSTEVLRINLRTGRLELENDAWSESSYENESEALDHLQSRGYEVAERGYALLGYGAAGATAGVLLATRVREKAVLPGGHTVYAVTDSAWAMVPLQNEAADAAAAAALAGLPPPRADGDFWRAMQQFTLNNAHYYCETADISRPFPSERDPRDPAPEFVWNSWLRQPLLELGLYDHCPALLQGAVECSAQQLPGCSTKFSMCLVSRRSRRHPGTRYIARGLNSMAGPGNEIECELLTWTHPEQQHFGGSSLSGAAQAMPGGGTGGVYSFSAAGAAVREGGIGGSSGVAGASRGSSSHAGGEPLRWARVVWRRGTVPIWWGVQLQSLAQGLQAEVYVREEHPYQGTASYFRNVQRQHQPWPALPAAATGEQAAAGEGGGGSEGWTLVEQTGAEASVSSSARTSALQSSAGAGVQAPGGGESEQDASCRVPVTCINLLHANPKKASELMLSSHFQDAMRHVRRRLGSGAPIKVVNFDWHGNMGRLSEEKAVEGFWSLMEPFVKQTGFAWGWMEPVHPQAEQPSSNGSSSSATAAAVTPGGDSSAAAAAAPATVWPPSWRMCWGGQQAGLLRFNCADSLDRTNAATCFAMLPVLQEQLRVLGIPLESAVPPATAALMRSRQRSSAGDMAALAVQQPGSLDAQEAAAAAGLPEGWEVRQHEGRLLYIDHINKTTQWAPPSPAAPGSGDASGSSTPSSARGKRPGSAGLSSRMMQSASDMLARLQQRSGPVAGTSAVAGSAQRATPMLNLERRSSPPRDGGFYAAGAGASGGGGSAHGGSFFSRSRNSSSGNLAGVPHAASAPDMTLSSSRPSTASEAPSSPRRSTQQQDPLRPWAFFSYDINDVRERLAKDAVSDYVEMFRVHGDIHSFLYTGSPAMHSHVLALVVQGGKGYGAVSGVGKLQNLRVAVQRRWNNTVSDTSRQQAMELFLGLRIQDRGDQKGYFPGLQLAYRDSTQAQLGGLEPFEFTPLPPAPHSRHSSNVPTAWGPLGAGAPAADAAAAAAAAMAHRLPLLEEESSAGMAASLQQAAEATQRQEARQEAAAGWEQYDRAHPVPGVPTVQHDGRLGVRQSLMDLEPLPDGEAYEQQPGGSPGGGNHQRSSSGGSGSLGLGGGSSSRLAQISGEPSTISQPLDRGALACSSGSGEEQAAEPAPPAHFDPLGAVPHPASGGQEQQQGQAWAGGDLLCLGEEDGGAAASKPASSGSAAVRSQLEDLLL